jgi:hypothetical protein
MPKLLQVIPKGLNEEDLLSSDAEFNAGLAEIGKKYGLRLVLPFWAYAK